MPEGRRHAVDFPWSEADFRGHLSPLGNRLPYFRGDLTRRAGA